MENSLAGTDTYQRKSNESFGYSENSADYKDYLSEGLTGPITDFSEKKFQSLTASHPEIFEQFQQEAIDNKVKDKRSKKTFKIQKYVIMYNYKNEN